jgi:hypothetical protein
MNTREETPFITALTRQTTELDFTIPNADTINVLFGQLNQCITVKIYIGT